jgi:hypothetical protein
VKITLNKFWSPATDVLDRLLADPVMGAATAIVLRPFLGTHRPPFEADAATYAAQFVGALSGLDEASLATVRNRILTGHGAFEARKRDLPPIADVVALARPFATAIVAQRNSEAAMLAAGLPPVTGAQIADAAALREAVTKVRRGADIWTAYHLDLARVVRRGRVLTLVVPEVFQRAALLQHGAATYLDIAVRALGCEELDIVPAVHFARQLRDLPAPAGGATPIAATPIALRSRP